MAAAIVSEGLRPLVEPTIPQGLSDILEDCWQLDSRRRPTAQQLVDRLKLIQSHANFADRPAVGNESVISTKQREEARKAFAAQSSSSHEEAGPAGDELDPNIKIKPPAWLENTSSEPVKVQNLEKLSRRPITDCLNGM